MSEPKAILRLRVQPRSSRNEVTEQKEGVWYVRLTAPPVEGTANKSCVEFMAERLGLKRSQVRLTAGEKSRDKIIEAQGITQDEAEARLARP